MKVGTLVRNGRPVKRFPPCFQRTHHWQAYADR